MIRELREADAPAVATLSLAINPHQVETPATVWHRATRAIEREQRRDWIAEEDGRIVGSAQAGFEWSVPTPGKGRFWIGVAPEARRRGVGAALFAQVEDYLCPLGAWRLRTWEDDDADGRRFLESRGFERRGADRVAELDLASAVLPEPGVPEGFRLVQLAEVRDRVEDLFAVSAAGELDMPGDEPETELDVESWKREEFEMPALTDEGSFVALAGERPVAVAYLTVDPERRLAYNQMTATLPEFRRRGLALTVKVATARWAAEHGFERILTENDETNAGMLAINERLGYRFLYDQTSWALETAAGRARGAPAR